MQNLENHVTHNNLLDVSHFDMPIKSETNPTILLKDMNGIETIGVVESVHRRWGKPIKHSSPEEEYDRSILGNIMKEYLSSTELTSNERSVLQKKYMEGWTTEAIAQNLDLSRSRISQIEARALRRLRHPSRVKLLRGFENGHSWGF